MKTQNTLSKTAWIAASLTTLSVIARPAFYALWACLTPILAYLQQSELEQVQQLQTLMIQF